MRKSVLAAFVGFLVTVFLFQNCGKISSLRAGDSANDQLDTDDMAFKKDQPYDPNLVPFVNEDPDFQKAITNYPNVSGYKAMAFTSTGDIYVGSSGSDVISSQEEWNQLILERCQIRYGGDPCSLFAAGDLIAQNSVDFLNGYFNRLSEIDADFNATQIPGLAFHWRMLANTSYPNFEEGQFKAYAINWTGGGHAGWSSASQEEANRRALEFCQSHSNQLCILYAVGLNVVFDSENIQLDQQRIFYGPRPLDINEVPLITETTRATRKEDIESVVTSVHFVWAIGRFGQDAIKFSANEITQADIDETVAACTAKLGEPAEGTRQDPSCFVYAIDNEVVWTWESYKEAVR